MGLPTTLLQAQEAAAAGMDGLYTYFAARGFVWTSSPETSWRTLSELCASHGMLWLPCVGPGYDDRRIRPWNAKHTRARASAYYASFWEAAMHSNPSAIAITSYNEWHEGTQIEPSESHPGYPDDPSPDHFLRQTKTLSDAFLKSKTKN